MSVITTNSIDKIVEAELNSFYYTKGSSKLTFSDERIIIAGIIHSHMPYSFIINYPLYENVSSQNTFLESATNFIEFLKTIKGSKLATKTYIPETVKNNQNVIDDIRELYQSLKFPLPEKLYLYKPNSDSYILTANPKGKIIVLEEEKGVEINIKRKYQRALQA